MKGRNHNTSAIVRWRRDPIEFIEHVCIDPDHGTPFRLYPEQKTFLRHAFERMPDGHLRYTELVFSGGKKSGKSTLAALIVIYVAVALALNRPFGLRVRLAPDGRGVQQGLLRFHQPFG